MAAVAAVAAAVVQDKTTRMTSMTFPMIDGIAAVLEEVRGTAIGGSVLSA